MRTFSVFIRAASFILFAIHTKATAIDMAYSFDYMQGEHSAQIVKLGLQYYDIPLNKYLKHSELYVESSINWWEYNAGNRQETVFSVSISPVMLYPLSYVANRSWYLEFGIGLAILSDSHFAGKDLGTNYQFEDRLGLVSRYGEKQQHQVALRYFHYSNGGLAESNPGVDYLSLSYSRQLY